MQLNARVSNNCVFRQATSGYNHVAYSKRSNWIEPVQIKNVNIYGTVMGETVTHQGRTEQKSKRKINKNKSERQGY